MFPERRQGGKKKIMKRMAVIASGSNSYSLQYATHTFIISSDVKNI
jgi:hypothetical protein